MASIYTTKPLKFGESTNIRVLEILHDPVYCSSAPISCKIQLIILEDDEEAQTPYNALSYVWGNADVTKTILVDGEPLIVRENLWQFLDQMRKVRYKKKIWIDAICINQQNNGEKSHQVAMMGEIYSKATRVEIWLGPPKDGTVRAMQTLSNLRFSRLSSYLVKTLRLHPLRAYLPFNLEWGYISKNWKAFADDLELFCNEEYWTRVWIVQEYALAKNHTIWCGNQKLDSMILKRIRDRRQDYLKEVRSGYLIRNEHRWTHPYHRITLHMFNSPAWIIIDTEVVKHNEHLLRNYAVIFASLHCSDVRDRIYAALPLLRMHYTEKQFPITPDYSLSVAELFEAVYDRYPIEERTSDRNKTSSYMSVIRDMLNLDREDETVERVFAKIWGLPVGGRLLEKYDTSGMNFVTLHDWKTSKKLSGPLKWGHRHNRLRTSKVSQTLRSLSL